MPITMKKLAALLSDPQLKWSDVETDDNFLNILKYIFPTKDWVSTSITR